MSETNPEPKKPTRLVQDSPIYLEVWRKYEEVLAEYEKERKKYKAKKKKYEKEIERVGLILTPFRGVPSSTLLNLVKQNLLSIPDKQEEDLEKWQLATTGEAVVANLNLDELLEAVLPLTQWWKDNFQVNTNKESQSKNEKESEEKNKRLEEDKRLNREWLEKKIESIGFEFNNEIISSPRIPDKNKQTVLWSVSLNREAFTSLFESVPATKADAARRLFDIDGSGIKWAVLDTGIDATHIGFRKLDKNGDRVERRKI